MDSVYADRFVMVSFILFGRFFERFDSIDYLASCDLAVET